MGWQRDWGPHPPSILRPTGVPGGSPGVNKVHPPTALMFWTRAPETLRDLVFGPPPDLGWQEARLEVPDGR